MKFNALKMATWIALFCCVLASQWAMAQSDANTFTDSLSTLVGTDRISLEPGEAEVVDIGYAKQKTTTVSTATVAVDAKNFNQGLISDPAQLVQGKIAGLQVYNRGGDPNRLSLLRIRGASLGANPNPLLVIDGIIDASFEMLDPNDVERITVLKDAAATAIYGARASSGVILIETKNANHAESGLHIVYLGQGAMTQVQSQVSVMNASEFRAAGGVDLGASTNWANEITQTGWSQTHGLVATQTTGQSNFRFSANYRNVEGILLQSGFKQLNTRLNFNTKTLNDRLRIDVNGAFTYRLSSYSFPEAFRYAVIANPTAPVLGVNAPYPFASEQYGGYFETLGLFDSFNPVSILEQNSHQQQSNNYVAGLNTSYQLTDKLMINGRLATQSHDKKERAFYRTTALFRGNASSPLRKGQADYLNDANGFNLYEVFLGYNNYQDKIGVQLLTGYTRQEFFSEQSGILLADFTSNDEDDFLSSFTPPANFIDQFVEAFTSIPPERKVNALFARAMFNWKQNVFLNTSLRTEKSNIASVDLPWTTFAAISLGTDLNKYMQVAAIDQLTLRAGWGGNAPNKSSAEVLEIIRNASSFSSTLIRSPRINYLRTQRQREFNMGIDLVMNRFQVSVDAYSRRAKDLWVELLFVDVFGVNNIYDNDTKTLTQGVELNLDYELIRNDKIKWQTSLVGSSYQSILKDYFRSAEVRANLGAPGLNGILTHRLAIGEEIGQIWGPIFTEVGSTGEPVFADVNRDGIVITQADQALSDNVDYEVLGQGFPSVELGWAHQITVGNWSLNAFFRSALGHSLVNVNRVFYEPNIAAQSSYNNVNTIFREPALTSAQFSSLYVERADFLKLDNLTLTKRFPFKNTTKSLSLSLTGQNLWVWTNYTGADPEPVLVDYGTVDNGQPVDYSAYDSASPGLDRRYSYWPSSTLVFGLKLQL